MRVDLLSQFNSSVLVPVDQMTNYWSKPSSMECGNTNNFSLFCVLQALKMDNFDAKLLSNRSLCWLRMGDGERSYDDATECKKLQPMWAKAYYRQGAAQILMEVQWDGSN